MSRFFDEYYSELIANEVIPVHELEQLIKIPKFARIRVMARPKLATEYINWMLRGKESLVHFTSQLSVLPDISSRFVFTFHDVIHLNPGLSGTKFPVSKNEQIRKAVDRARFIITDSEVSRRKILSYYQCSEDKISVVYPVVPSANRVIHPRNRRKSVLFIGTNAPRKNIIGFLEAMREYQDRYGDVAEINIVSDLDAFGAGDNYREVIRSLRICNLRLHSRLPIQELNGLYEESGVLVFPTLQEGFGLPPLEAQSVGLPVVASDIPIMHEVLGESCVFCNPLSSTDIMKAVRQVLSDQQLAGEMHERGLSNVLRFGKASSVQKTLDAYRAAAR